MDSPGSSSNLADSKRISKKETKRTNSTGNLTRSPSIEKLFTEMRLEPVHGSPMIREAAETLLLQLLNQYNNHPSRGGIQLTGSTYCEYEVPDVTTLYFSYYDVLIIACVDIVSSNGGNFAKQSNGFLNFLFQISTNSTAYNS